jgi:hypothetical protein
MGYGNYSFEAHQAISLGRTDLPAQEVFKQRTCHPLMSPHGVRFREARDSAEHPESLAVVFALDVTGSMGEIPDQLARRDLPGFMKVLLDCGVDHTQVLFMAVGDATCDKAPLQVGQFESTAELMDQWLTWSFLEGGGGGQNTESYELALYFLAQHTRLDCWEKRQKRGYLLMTGDELPYPRVSRHQVDSLVGDHLDQDLPIESVVAALQKTYEPFFLIPDPARRSRCEARWRELLGEHVIAMESPLDTCHVGATLIALGEGRVADVDDAARRLSAAGLARERVGAVVRAVTPYAATLGRAGVPEPKEGFWSRLTGGGGLKRA